MTTSRERVMRALNFQPVDRVPRDLAGMRSTGISVFAYPHLVEALGLPSRLPKAEDTYQMLALPELDVLDALGIDVVTIADDATNAFDQPDLWKPYDFGGRLPAVVRDPSRFHEEPDGTIVQGGRLRMPPSSVVFDEAHGGQPLDLMGDIPKPDLDEIKRALDARLLTDAQVEAKRAFYQQVRESTDRAVFLNDGAVQMPIAIDGWGGLGVFPVLCVLEPDHIRALHDIYAEYTEYNLRALLSAVGPYVDIIMMAADDWGTQNTTIASPKVCRDLFVPYWHRLNDAVHEVAPETKTFMHSCGAIYDVIDLMIDGGFDILNPVQWCAGEPGYKEWKDRARGRIALWGGGVDSQHTLPKGSVDDVIAEVHEVVSYMVQDSGYVFCNIHNIMAEIAPEKVIAMYQAAGEIRV
ncbi:MAG: uroporphyrinogen decarboxylase family protein [Anaerolineae bacterium]